MVSWLSTFVRFQLYYTKSGSPCSLPLSGGVEGGQRVAHTDVSEDRAQSNRQPCLCCHWAHLASPVFMLLSLSGLLMGNFLSQITKLVSTLSMRSVCTCLCWARPACWRRGWSPRSWPSSEPCTRSCRRTTEQHHRSYYITANVYLLTSMVARQMVSMGRVTKQVMASAMVRWYTR